MRPRPSKAPSLSTLRRAAVVATLAALAVIFVSTGSAKPAPTGTYQVCITAGSGSSACSPTAAGGDYSIVSSLANNGLQVTITNDSTSNQTLDYANLPVPATIGTINTGLSASATNYSAFASTSTATMLQLRNLALAPGGSKTIAFVMSPAASCTDGAWAPLVAQSAANGNFFTFPQPTVTSGLTTLVAIGCTLDFTVQPTAALVNTVVTGQAYTSGAANVTVTPHGLPVALGIGSATVAASGDSDPGNLATFTGTGPVRFSGGSAVFTALQSNGTGGPFTLTAHAAGFADAVSNAFVITQNGESCNGACATLNGKSGNDPLVSIATSGGFSYVGASPSGVPQDANGNYPTGCQSWTPTTGASGFVEFDGRTTGGSLQISYFVSQTVLKARYGKNTGNQFVPICFGVKYLDANQQPLDCRTNPNPNGGWLGDHLTNGAFDGGTAQALCGAGGFYWGILSSYQDKLDPSVNPVVTGFNGPTNPGQNFRTFVISIPPGIDARGGC